jgi:hypothetical protein
MAEISVAPSAREFTELVECPRHEGEECARCDGSGFRPRRCCEGCGELSGRPSEGGRVLIGLKNARGKNQPMWCLFCHPEHRYLDAVWSGLERMGGWSGTSCSL